MQGKQGKSRVLKYSLAFYCALLAQVATADEAVLPMRCVIDQDQSRAFIRVYKEGPLAALGDNHLISTSDVSGPVHFHSGNTSLSYFSLRVNTRSLVVNDPAERARAEPAFNSRVSDWNRRITRRSMLGSKVLDTENYPQISIESVRLPGTTVGRAEIALTLRGVTNIEQAEVAFRTKDSRLKVDGSFFLHQTRYGIKPFSILLGGIRVKDRLRLDFSVEALCGS